MATEKKAKKSDKPNILVIFGDDIGYWNVGAYTHGMMGRTPNIDSIAEEGMLFTDHYGQASCTAGRAAFIMGQVPIRTGMTTTTTTIILTITTMRMTTSMATTTAIVMVTRTTTTTGTRMGITMDDHGCNDAVD